ncbi:MAG: ribose-phosphate pyrophosphokinase [Planctomycetota bacterium]
MVSVNKLRILSGTAHRELSEKIAEYLNLPLVDTSISKFPDGEINSKIEEDMRGKDVFVIQPTCAPVNENLMELLLLIDCLRRASAQRITAVIPYFGYARQDRKAEGRVPITAKLVANLLTTAGVERILTMDLHAAQIQGFFDIPVDELWAAPVFFEHYSQNPINDLTVVSPDVGGLKLARAYAKKLNGELAIVDKRRTSGSTTTIYHIIGEVKDRNLVIVDDMIATAGSINEAARIAKERGARDIFICATHAVLTPGALEKLDKPFIKEVSVSDTIPRRNNFNKLKVLTVSKLFGEAIKRIHEDRSVSALFDF